MRIYPYCYIENKGIIFCCLLGLTRQKQKRLPHRFRWGINYVLSFIIFLFCRRCSFSRSRRCMYLNSRMSSLYFSVRGCASLCGDAIKFTNSALAQYCILPSLMPTRASSCIHSWMRCGLCQTSSSRSAHCESSHRRVYDQVYEKPLSSASITMRSAKTLGISVTHCPGKL